MDRGLSSTVFGHYDINLSLWPQFQDTRVRSIFSIVFEVWTQNSMHLRFLECRIPFLSTSGSNLQLFVFLDITKKISE